MGESVAAGVQPEAQEAVKGAIGGGVLGTLAGNVLAGVTSKKPRCPEPHRHFLHGCW